MRYTKKVMAAIDTLKNADVEYFADHEWLYAKLAELGYMWDSKAGEWLHLPSMAADEPSPLIKIRVWADKGKVKAVADKVINGMSSKHYGLLERSEVLPCRPPKHSEARIYLIFQNK